MQVTARANILNFPTSTTAPKGKEWEDAVYKPVNAISKKVTTIVYNNFSIEAILSARILKQCYPEFEVISAAQRVEVKSDLYVWIGIDPDELITKEMAKKEHRVYSSHVQLETDTVGIRPSIIDQVCEDFMVVMSQHIFRMSFQAARFYQANTDIVNLAIIYQDVIESIDFLKGLPVSLKFEKEPTISVAALMDKYMHAVKRVKIQFNKNYRETYAVDGGHLKTTIHTTFSDHDFIIALRLMKLSHSNFINHVTSINGDLVYSNMPDLQLDHQHHSIIMLN